MKSHSCLIHEGEVKKLYQVYYKDLYFFAISTTKDSDVAKDIIHDFFISYWEKRSKGIKAPSNFIGYAKVAIRNLSVDYIRKQVLIERTSAKLLDSTDIIGLYDDTESSEDRYQRLNKIYKLIDELPKGQREVLKLHAMEKLTYKEIAAEKGITINTVRTHLTRAYSKLRKTGSHLLLTY